MEDYYHCKNCRKRINRDIYPRSPFCKASCRAKYRYKMKKFAQKT